MEETNLYTARVQMVEAMEQGLPWHEAAKHAGLQISQSTAYRLRQRVRKAGEPALREGRHGHPIKLRGEVRKFLEETCRQAPHTPSHEVQTQLAQRFSIQVSVSQINRVRASARGEQSAAKCEKKVSNPRGEPEWQEGAGGLLLLAAAHETALLSQLEDVLPIKQQSSSGSQPSPPRLFHPQRSLLLTLLFLPAVELHRFWDLRSYTGQELALLTGRAHPYSYRHTERFLLILAAAQADQALTEALARWTAAVWQGGERCREAYFSSFYVDGHRKPVYTESLIPRGLIGRLGKIAGCRTLVLLHDEQGHPLLVTTHRGDLHLTQGMPQLLTSYEQVTESTHLNHLVVDREVMAADFLAQLSTEGRTLTTILKTSQYSGLDDFLNIGPFVPLTVDGHGTVLREVAPAQFWLSRPDRQDEPLLLSVALIRDLRKSVLSPPSEDELPRSWWADIMHEEVAWWQEGWQATAAPAQPT